MALAEAAQPVELQSAADNGHYLQPDGNDLPNLFARMAESVKTGWDDLYKSQKPDAAQSLTKDLVNGTGSFESVVQNIDDLKSQGKLNDFSDQFKSIYQTSVRDQLIQNYPCREADIDKALGADAADKPDLKLAGLNREQLQEVFKKFPALEGVITSPDVLGAVIQNEKDHTYGLDDRIIDGTLRGFTGLTRFFGLGDGTDFVSKMNPKELREQADKSGGFFGLVNRWTAGLYDRVLRTSIGDGQVQMRNIVALQNQERAAGRDVPTISSSLTPKGSAELVGAYFTKSIQMLNDGTIEDPSKNPFWKNSPAVIEGFKEAQRLWNTGDPVLKERAVMMTYNPGISSSDPEAWNPEHILKHYLGRK
ncbi:hypothetical protein KA183_05425 [bacterium]|nr:hypothetical protein [bacterium]QQR56635.1 MAG: hypothetical protein IPG59_16755 [Candidatus Melainabacteria bacterium]